ncbi:MAG: MATE family efflux transporter [Planctomycetota bacterium]
MSRLGVDLASSYALSVSRIVSWAAVFAIVWRQLGPEAFAVLALARSTIGILRVTGLGLGPATLRLLAEERARQVEPLSGDRREPLEESSRRSPIDGETASDAGPGIRSAHPSASPGSITNATPTPRDEPRESLDADRADSTPKAERSEASGNAVPIALEYDTPREPIHRPVLLHPALLGFPIIFVIGIAGMVYAESFHQWHKLTVTSGVWYGHAEQMVMWLSFAVALRVGTDWTSGFLQSRGWLWLDNSILTLTELLWPIVLVMSMAGRWNLSDAGFALFVAEAIGAGLRLLVSLSTAIGIRVPIARLLTLGGFTTLAAAADYLYAPIDYILLNRFVPGGIETYAPAVMFDSALLLVGSGIAAVVLPYSALADAAGDRDAVRRQYVRGTLASVALLVAGAVVVWLAAPLVFRLWLGEDLPATRAILPFVLLHTIIGGSGAVGRSVLLGMGRAKALAISVIAFGALNAAISTAAVLLGFGLAGVIVGTLVAVTGRCVVWMPWYILRVLAADLDKSAD